MCIRDRDHTVEDDEVLPIGKAYDNYRVFLIDEHGNEPAVGEQVNLLDNITLTILVKIRQLNSRTHFDSALVHML